MARHLARLRPGLRLVAQEQAADVQLVGRSRPGRPRGPVARRGCRPPRPGSRPPARAAMRRGVVGASRPTRARRRGSCRPAAPRVAGCSASISASSRSQGVARCRRAAASGRARRRPSPSPGAGRPTTSVRVGLQPQGAGAAQRTLGAGHARARSAAAVAPGEGGRRTAARDARSRHGLGDQLRRRSPPGCVLGASAGDPLAADLQQHRHGEGRQPGPAAHGGCGP